MRNCRIYVNFLLSYLTNDQEDISQFELISLIFAERKIRLFFENMIISIDKKIKLLNSAFTELKVAEKIGKFFKYLLNNGRAKLLITICRQYLIAAYKKIGRSHVILTTARNLGAEERNIHREKIEKLLNIPIYLEYREDHGMIGGVIINMDGDIIDNSHRRKLQLVNRSIRQELHNMTLLHV